MNISGMVELANHISESLNNHYRDIGDIEFLIEELNKKKKGIARRMQTDAAHLRTIMTDATFASNVNEQAMADFREALDGVDELVEIINESICGKLYWWGANIYCDKEFISISHGIMNVMRKYVKHVKCLLIVLLIILINDYTDT